MLWNNTLNWQVEVNETVIVFAWKHNVQNATFTPLYYDNNNNNKNNNNSLHCESVWGFIKSSLSFSFYVCVCGDGAISPPRALKGSE